MKKLFVMAQALVLGCLLFATPVHAKEEGKEITHVIMVWLNNTGDEKVREEFVKISETLNDLPGIVYRHVGIVSTSDRQIVDDTFDVAITVTLKDKAALKGYLEHPKHKEVLKKIKPMVNRVVAYDFVTP